MRGAQLGGADKHFLREFQLFKLGQRIAEALTQGFVPEAQRFDQALRPHQAADGKAYAVWRVRHGLQHGRAGCSGRLDGVDQQAGVNVDAYD